MGSDDLFKKRKARKAEEQARKKAKRKPYDKVLIVCEGEKTEPIYFEEVRVFYELDIANVEVDGDCGSSPINVVNHAYCLHEKALKSGDIYNRVFCVFDRDNHSSFDEAIAKVDQINVDLEKAGLGKQIIFESIPSIPSFEYWFLLHYQPTTKPYAATPTKSVGDLVIDDLKVYLPLYKKTQKGLFKKSLDEGTYDGAMAHSERIYENAIKSGVTNPSTKVHQLMAYLEELKNKKIAKSKK
ncbi:MULTISPECIES: RloB family protein [Vibrio]|uniref:RloB family protein n=1 Tax=Vibrio TaxID=662 RepID=UPI00031F7857|nr:MULTISPECIES: RloB family protein [Vibrio]BDU37932.1 hypothetical protein TUMSATVNIG2_24010 [Vibrio nigripulchritudo]BDU43654.1 hypothetical protein TUMSATVNIG3_24520 [Vibrio nigripulchritudo]